MFSLNDITNENNKDQNKKMAIYSRSSKQNVNNWMFWIKKNKYFYLIKEKDNDSLIERIYLYAKDLSEPKNLVLVKRSEDVGIKHLDDKNAFIEPSVTMDDVYENINEYDQARTRKVLTVFDML